MFLSVLYMGHVFSGLVNREPFMRHGFEEFVCCDADMGHGLVALLCDTMGHYLLSNLMAG
jgi:hypothetical protein